MIDVMKELKDIRSLFGKQRYADALESLESLWGSISEPKHETQNSFLIIMYGVQISLVLGDLDKAWAWASLAPKYNGGRQDIGEAEFLVGQVAYEKGDFDAAAENFKVANRKSGGRAFRGEDQKYKAII